MSILIFLMTITVYQIIQSTEIITAPEIARAEGFQDEATNEATDDTTDIIINEDAVRIRIIPHSNTYQDQLSKRMVSYAIDELLAENEEAFSNLETTRNFIQNNIGLIENRVTEIFDTINYEQEFEITYGAHLFPEKQYNGETLPAGYYESLVIRIGEGRGNNWWCFINPGTCLGPNVEDINANSENNHWNTQNQTLENTQNAIRNQNFTSYLNGIFENLIKSSSETQNKESDSFVAGQVADNLDFDWFLFEDER